MVGAKGPRRKEGVETCRAEPWTKVPLVFFCLFVFFNTQQVSNWRLVRVGCYCKFSLHLQEDHLPLSRQFLKSMPGRMLYLQDAKENSFVACGPEDLSLDLSRDPLAV